MPSIHLLGVGSIIMQLMLSFVISPFAHLGQDLPNHDHNLYGLQWNVPCDTSHNSAVGALRPPRKHVGEEGKRGKQNHNAHNDCYPYTSGGVIRALGAGEP